MTLIPVLSLPPESNQPPTVSPGHGQMKEQRQTVARDLLALSISFQVIQSLPSPNFPLTSCAPAVPPSPHRPASPAPDLALQETVKVVPVQSCSLLPQVLGNCSVSCRLIDGISWSGQTPAGHAGLKVPLQGTQALRDGNNQTSSNTPDSRQKKRL